MRHEWIFDVLDDLKTYARLNGLPRLEERVADALSAARLEVCADGASPLPLRAEPGDALRDAGPD